MDVHVRDLRYFLAVARELSFTRAAETLYISQPALSKQIRALERQLRVSLFARESTGARLSRAGSELVPFAERMVAEWEAAKAALARASDSTLVLGMHTSPGRRVLPEVRARLVAACPDAVLELRQVAWAGSPRGTLRSSPAATSSCCPSATLARPSSSWRGTSATARRCWRRSSASARTSSTVAQRRNRPDRATSSGERQRPPPVFERRKAD